MLRIHPRQYLYSCPKKLTSVACVVVTADYTYMFPPRRSQQIAAQASKNLEISILAGVAKHVGFPAAPEIEEAPLPDVVHDLQSMGI